MTSIGVPWAVLNFREAKYSSLNPAGLYSSTFSIGRSPNCDLVLEDAEGTRCVSGKHVEISKDGHKILVTDFSSNGTVVNGQKHLKRGNRAALDEGDIVHLVKHPTDPNLDISFIFSMNTDTHCRNTPPLVTETIAPNDLNETLPVPEEDENDAQSGTVAPLTRIRDMQANGAVVSAAPAAKADSNPMAETLLCSICCEIIHSCISLQPCMHSFCGGCYSDWMSRSNKCPECRAEVVRISKNHIINNVIETFLNQNPDKKRSVTEIAELEAKNKITDDMLYPPKSKKSKRYEDRDEEPFDVDESEGSLSDEEDSNDSQPITAQTAAACAALAAPAAACAQNAANVISRFTVCYQCPGYPDSTVKEVVLRKAPLYVCPANGNHILCQCCQQLFPDRRDNVHLPPTKCSVCSAHFCHLYWGCRSRTCKGQGCLMQLKDFIVVDSEVEYKILSENAVESEILGRCLAHGALSWSDMFVDGLKKVDEGQVQPRSPNVTSESVLCANCCLREAQQIAYDYRKNIDAYTMLGLEKKHDCHWGRNCRTQKHNLDHAQRYNHICDQTKFT